MLETSRPARSAPPASSSDGALPAAKGGPADAGPPFAASRPVSHTCNPIAPRAGITIGNEEAADEEATVRTTSWGRIGVGLVAALALSLTACAKGDGAGSGGAPTIKIVSPAEGSSVSVPFKVEVSSNVALGETSTGNDHVHLCFDGGDCSKDYTIGYGSSIEVTDLSAGQHTIEASLRNADHSDAGASATVTVTVTGSGGTGTGTGGSTGGGYSRDYG